MADYREIPPDELKKILEAQRNWVESEGKEGEKVYLVKANLQGANLREAYLRGVKFARGQPPGGLHD